MKLLFIISGSIAAKKCPMILKELSRHKELGMEIRKTYFEPVTHEGVMNFLDFKKDSTFAKS